MSPEILPSFERPPVVEVVAGVRFSPLASLQLAHVGLFWGRIRSKFPLLEEHFPIEDGSTIGQIQQLKRLPLPRQFFLSKDQTQLIQLQRDRFLSNWRKYPPEQDTAYPRYPKIRDSFEECWKEFERFIEEEDLGPIKSPQCELSYVNHFVEGDGWARPSEISKMLSIIEWSGARNDKFELPNPDRMSFQVGFACSDCNGSLTHTLKHGVRQTDGKVVYALDVSVKGAPGDGTVEKIVEWMDLAHIWIVQSFTAMTTEYAHKLWKRET